MVPNGSSFPDRPIVPLHPIPVANLETARQRFARVVLVKTLLPERKIKAGPL